MWKYEPISSFEVGFYVLEKVVANDSFTINSSKKVDLYNFIDYN